MAAKQHSLVSLLNSEVALFFMLPMAFWALALAIAYAVFGFGHDFRVACSLLWSVFALTTVASMLVILVTGSISNDFVPGKVSARSKFSDFCELAIQYSGYKRIALITFGVAKVSSVFFGAGALIGGVMVVMMWLVSGNYFRIGV